MRRAGFSRAALAAVLLGGCSLPMRGDLEEPLPKCQAAAAQVLRDLRIPVSTDPRGNLAGALEDGRSLRIDFEPLGGEATRVTVTVGSTRDAHNSADAAKLLEKIAGALAP
jgi:hypothetical protein